MLHHPNRRFALNTWYPQAADFFGRLATEPDTPRMQAYDFLIRALCESGVWAKLDALYIFAAADQATALTNLVQSSYGATAVNSPSFTADQGYDVTQGISWITSGFAPSTAGGHFTQNSCSVLAWSLTSAGKNNELLIGSANKNELAARWTDNNSYIALSSSAETIVASADGSGLWSVARQSSSTITLYRNGASVSSGANTSASLDTSTLTFGQVNGATHDTLRVAAGGFGAGLSDAEELALYNAMHAYMQTVARVA